MIIKSLARVTYQEIFIALQKGEIIAYPTDTIYGLGADIFNQTAVEKLFEIKGRDASKTFSLLYFDLKKVRKDFDRLTDYEKQFIQLFLPGPVTLVLRTQYENQFPNPFIKKGFAGIRVLHHFALNRLMANFPNPITSTSINPLTQIAQIIDAGPMKNKRASTVLQVHRDNYTILRESAVSKQEIERKLQAL
ncbi:MAG: L-threonylcarbamoyladenylate synthase [Candidatus Marinimicrobia bacterium]|nr:L-threonylcarbamoyladenylate synthase [Candidatus Neomarinimicrobiota bacterium]